MRSDIFKKRNLAPKDDLQRGTDFRSIKRVQKARRQKSKNLTSRVGEPSLPEETITQVIEESENQE